MFESNFVMRVTSIIKPPMAVIAERIPPITNQIWSGSNPLMANRSMLIAIVIFIIDDDRVFITLSTLFAAVIFLPADERTIPATVNRIKKPPRADTAAIKPPLFFL